LGVDYIVNQPCKVKETLSVEGMVALIKQRYRAVAMIEATKEGGKSDEQAINATFQIMLAAPGGVQSADVRVSELFAGTEKLDDLQIYCRYCPASAGKPFGCYRIISYPISRKAEEWLAATAGKAAAGSLAILPLEYILERNIDGGNISKMRADPDDAFFELKQPLDIPVRTGTGPCDRKMVNTDQVFNLLLGMRRIGEDCMKMLLPMSGGLTVTKEEPAPGTYQVAFPTPYKDGTSSWWAYCLNDETEDDTSTLQLKEFFRMMALALALHRDMTVSL
jgi:hypothetical protein